MSDSKIHCKDNEMIEVTELAQEKLLEYLKVNSITSPVRIALMQGGCSGPALGLALDEAKSDDLVTSFDALTFLVENKLLDVCGSISVDFLESGDRSGFSISSSNPLPGAGGGCSSGSCGSSGCGC